MTDTLHDRQQKLIERRVANSQTENVNSISTEQLNDLISNHQRMNAGQLTPEEVRLWVLIS